MGCSIPKRIKAADRPKVQETSVPREVKGQGITVNWLEKLPNGGARPVLDIEAETLKLTNGTKSGEFRKAQGYLYRDGKKVVRFEAPIVDATEEKQLIAARGRVRVFSVDPAGAVIEADRVTWSIRTNRIIAEGGVVTRYQRQGEARPTMWSTPAPYAVVDTEMKEVTLLSRAPGGR